jgi:beta-glucosidase
MSEAFSEDTYLATEMVVRAVLGMQGHYKGLTETHIGAVTKHFAGYGQIAGGLNFASIEISPRTFMDEILPPFKAAVQRASTLGIMPSHGDINGVACHASVWLLTELLRDEWGFVGYVVSDSNDVPRLYYFMKVAESPEEAAIQGLIAGVDVDLYSDDGYVYLPQLVKERPELEKYIDRATARVLRTKFVLGLFDNPYVDEAAVSQITRNEEAVALAHEVDLESVILLKNNQQVLPLAQTQRKRIALVGPLLNENTKESFEEVAGDRAVFTAEKGFSLTNEVGGVPDLSDSEENLKGIKKIMDVASKSDMIFLFVGGDEFTAKEAFFNNALGDRDNIDPVGEQDLLLLELKKLGKPVVVVLKHRRTLSVNTFDEYADAILGCWDLSEFGDKAVAKIIFGDAAPSGKLTVTVPRSIGQIPFHYSQKEINYKKQYLFTQSTPLYPFGFGLSYTNFKYSNLNLTNSVISKQNIDLKVNVDVTNIGNRTGKEVVQLYVKDMIGSVLRPDKELKGFEKIELQPGETKTVSFHITPEMLEFTGLEMKRVIEPGDFVVMIGTSSAQFKSIPFKLTK